MPEHFQARPSLRCLQVGYLDLRERPWVVDRWGLTRGRNLITTGELLPDGKLRVRIASSHGFSGTTLLLDLERGPTASAVHGTVTVTDWNDESSSTNWREPTGTILLSTVDWSRVGVPGAPPILIEIRLHDVPMTEGACLHGVVEIPQQPTQ